MISRLLSFLFVGLAVLFFVLFVTTNKKLEKEEKLRVANEKDFKEEIEKYKKELYRVQSENKEIQAKLDEVLDVMKTLNLPGVEVSPDGNVKVTQAPPDLQKQERQDSKEPVEKNKGKKESVWKRFIKAGMSVADVFTKKSIDETIENLKKEIGLTDPQADKVRELLNERITAQRKAVEELMNDPSLDPFDFSAFKKMEEKEDEYRKKWEEKYPILNDDTFSDKFKAILSGNQIAKLRELNAQKVKEESQSFAERKVESIKHYGIELNQAVEESLKKELQVTYEKNEMNVYHLGAGGIINLGSSPLQAKKSGFKSGFISGGFDEIDENILAKYLTPRQLETYKEAKKKEEEEMMKMMEGFKKAFEGSSQEEPAEKKKEDK